MGRIHAVLCYYLLPTDLNVDVKSIKSSFEVESNSVIDDEKVTLRWKGNAESSREKMAIPEVGRKFIRHQCIVATEFIRTLEACTSDCKCVANMIDASLTAIKHSALLSSARQISL